jgi:hypothetical protein
MNVFTATYFQDADAARKAFESILWPNGPVCPHCESKRLYGTKRAGRYRCANPECRHRRHVGAGVGQHAADLEPDPPRRPGHQRPLAGEREPLDECTRHAASPARLRPVIAMPALDVEWHRAELASVSLQQLRPNSCANGAGARAWGSPLRLARSRGP